MSQEIWLLGNSVAAVVAGAGVVIGGRSGCGGGGQSGRGGGGRSGFGGGGQSGSGDTYLRNAMRYLNETWDVYTRGVAAAITRK